ncbi:hypothetical protein BJ912DRAFT_988165 [Pholiota molesta]|jgi:hypothetical protein|nr:hypothetical protein BJ912DRAFT_988165 [Pholiota molesta]
MLPQIRTTARRRFNLVSLSQASNVLDHHYHPPPLQPTASRANLHSTPTPSRVYSRLRRLAPPKAIKMAHVTGDYSILGTESSEYFHVDTDPSSKTIPYEDPKTSGSQLRYGGRGYTPKDNMEAFSEMSKSTEGPSGTESGGRQPEQARKVSLDD